MRLPAYLRFLEPKLRRAQQPELCEGLSFEGHIRIERQTGDGVPELVHDSKNFIVDVGVTAIRDLLIGLNGGGFAGSIFRMAVGDGGVPVGELFNPILPDATWPARTGLYHEIIRQDISIFDTPTDNSMRFVGSFNSIDINSSSYSLLDRVINEASLIIGDGVTTIGGDKKQINNTDTGPDIVDADEIMLSTRTFNSASFDASEDVTITITWTLTVATS
jgi:hypothetical protein